MHVPLRSAAIGLLVSLVMPAAGFAADTGSMEQRAAERAAARKAQAAVERRIPTEPGQTPRKPSVTARTAVPRTVRFHRVEERPSRRTIREQAGQGSFSSSSARSSSSRRTSSSAASRVSASSVRPEPASSLVQPPLDARRQEVLRLVNAERAKENLSPLTYNTRLEQAAQAHVQDMFDRDFFAHETPEGGTFDERIEAAGYPGACPYAGCRARIAVGENLAKGYQSAETVLKGWMDSPGHKANILNPLFKELGVGIVGTFWSQEFGGVEYLD